MLWSPEIGESAGSPGSSCSNYSGERLGVARGNTWLPMRPLGAPLSRMCQIPARGRAERSSFGGSDKSEVNKMEYLIIVGVVAMMALYALIIARCLKAPECQ